MKKIFFIITLSLLTQNQELLEAKESNQINEQGWKTGIVINGLIATAGTCGFIYNALKHSKTKKIIADEKEKLTKEEFYELIKKNVHHKMWALVSGTIGLIGIGGTIFCILGLNNSHEEKDETEGQIETIEASTQTRSDRKKYKIDPLAIDRPPEVFLKSRRISSEKVKRAEKYQYFLELANLAINDKIESSNGGDPSYKDIKRRLKRRARQSRDAEALLAIIDHRLGNKEEYIDIKLHRAIEFLERYKNYPSDAIINNTGKFFSDNFKSETERALIIKNAINKENDFYTHVPNTLKRFKK